MTREETITNLEKLAALFYTESEQSKMVDYSKIIEALEFAIAALRPVSREQVEKVWRGEWKPIERLWKYSHQWQCSRCGQPTLTDQKQFCDSCGAPMTDEAVEIRLKELEALHNEVHGQ